jgi:hypothetical protein
VPVVPILGAPRSLEWRYGALAARGDDPLEKPACITSISETTVVAGEDCWREQPFAPETRRKRSTGPEHGKPSSFRGIIFHL